MFLQKNSVLDVLQSPKYRSSRSQMFLEIDVLKNFAISQENEIFKKSYFYRTPPVPVSVKTLQISEP